MPNFIQIGLKVSVLRMRDFISRPSAQSDSATFLGGGGGVLEKGYSRDTCTDFDAKYVLNDAVPRKKVPFGGHETKI